MTEKFVSLQFYTIIKLFAALNIYINKIFRLIVKRCSGTFLQRFLKRNLCRSTLLVFDQVQAKSKANKVKVDLPALISISTLKSMKEVE